MFRFGILQPKPIFPNTNPNHCTKWSFLLLPLPYCSLSCNLDLQTTMAMTLKYDRSKGRINGTLNNINYEYYFNFNNKSD